MRRPPPGGWGNQKFWPQKPFSETRGTFPGADSGAGTPKGRKGGERKNKKNGPRLTGRGGPRNPGGEKTAGRWEFSGGNSPLKSGKRVGQKRQRRVGRRGQTATEKAAAPGERGKPGNLRKEGGAAESGNPGGLLKTPPGKRRIMGDLGSFGAGRTGGKFGARKGGNRERNRGE